MSHTVDWCQHAQLHTHHGWQARSGTPGGNPEIFTPPLPQVLFRDNKFQWKRLQNLIQLAQGGTGGGLDLSDTLSDGARMVLLDPRLRTQLIMALTEDNRLHIQVGI